MSTVEDFVQLIENEGFWELGRDCFIGGVEPDKPEDCWWVLSAGGRAGNRSVTGERKKEYILTVFYRDRNQRVVYNEINRFEELVNGLECPELGSVPVSIEVTAFPVDNDRDFEDRSIASVQVTIQVL